jgi:drug/metabolite transporter (DMT)-like permease
MLSALLAALAACSNACASICQRKANRDEPDELSLRPSLLIDLVHRPVWLAGFGAVLVSFVLQATALSHGAIALVEPILTGELPLTLGLAAIVFRRRLTSREWGATAALTAGLALFILFLSPGGAGARGVGSVTWGVGIGATVGVMAALVLAGRRHRGASAALYGVATGIGFGLTAALMTPVSQTGRVDFLGVFSLWQTYAMAASGLLAMFLLQTALQAGSLAAAQPGITIADPIVAVAWGTVAFHEHVSTGLSLAGAGAGAACMVLGAVLLTRSSLVVGEDEPAPG